MKIVGAEDFTHTFLDKTFRSKVVTELLQNYVLSTTMAAPMADS